jgi:hypothetical protein
MGPLRCKSKESEPKGPGFSRLNKPIPVCCDTSISPINGVIVMKTFTELVDKMFSLKQRKNRRFKVRNRVFVVFGPLLHKAKPVIDISMSGLSYLDGENQPTRSYGLNILADDSLYFDDKISFISIWKSETADLPDNSDKKNRCAVKFKRLTLGQKSKLKNLIRSHTTA